jgi:hypothetical protein
MPLEIESSNLSTEWPMPSALVARLSSSPFLGPLSPEDASETGRRPPFFFPLFASGAGTPEANVVEWVTGAKLRARPKKRMPLF